MAKVLCPCGCGERFEPKINGTSIQLYFSKACGNRARVRRCRKKQRDEARQNQRALKFQPAAKSDRRKKGHVRPEPKPVEKAESMFA